MAVVVAMLVEEAGVIELVPLPPAVRTFRYDEDGELEKRCSICHEWWPADREFFQSCSRNFGGLHSQCNACFLEGCRRRKGYIEERVACSRYGDFSW